MSTDDARKILGLTGTIDADALRRAYLRELKTHKPEKDPEGFRRVRDAYELLRESVWAWRAAGDEPVAAPAVHESSGGAAELSESSAEPPEAFFDTAPDPSFAPFAPVAPLADDPVLDDVDAELAQAGDADARIAILRRAISAHPELEDLHLSLSNELEDAGRDEERLEALRAARAAGHEQCGWALFEAYPEALDDEELRELRAKPSIFARELLARALVAREDNEQAIQIALASIIECQASRHERPDRWLDLALRFHEEGDVGRAIRLDRAVRDAMRAQGREAEISLDAQVRYELSRQLAALDDAFPLRLRAAIARAIRDGDLLSARDEAAELSEHLAAVASDRLRRHAPDISSALEMALSPAQADRRPATNGSSPWLWVVLPFVFLLIHTGRAACGSSRPELPVATYRSPEAIESTSAHPANIPEELAGPFLRLCDDYPEHCSITWAWVTAVHSRDCREATVRLRALRDALGGPTASDGQTAPPRQEYERRAASVRVYADDYREILGLHRDRCGPTEER